MNNYIQQIKADLYYCRREKKDDFDYNYLSQAGMETPGTNPLNITLIKSLSKHLMILTTVY